MSDLDLIPWRFVDPPVTRRRLRSLAPAAGWYAVYGWRGADGTIELDWQPVACWAIERADRDGEGLEDEVRAIVRVEDGALLSQAGEGGLMDRPLALHTEAERHDETVLGRLRDAAREHLDREDADRAQMKQQQAVVFGFVQAQPDPAAFAAKMRTGATSLIHAWLAITLAFGDPSAAIALARESHATLATKYRTRPATR